VIGVTLMANCSLSRSERMYSRRSVVFGLAFVAILGAPAFAADQSAQDFVAGIYAAYKGKDAKGIRLSERGVVARYFSPALARLIDADAKAAKHRQGRDRFARSRKAQGRLAHRRDPRAERIATRPVQEEVKRPAAPCWRVTRLRSSTHKKRGGD
jgi:hypothetical protein